MKRGENSVAHNNAGAGMKRNSRRPKTGEKFNYGFDSIHLSLLPFFNPVASKFSSKFHGGLIIEPSGAQSLMLVCWLFVALGVLLMAKTD
jgi:hypothetical protein